MSKNLKRIIRDKKMILTDPLIDNNIIVIHDETDVNISRACIIGPSDTPYAHGFYFFELRFPDNYPYEPFKVSFLTNDGKTRMHPNYYTCGKVCVSIIGTWNGPGWTSCQTLSSVLLTLQSLFIKNPLHQEPGFENDFSDKNNRYNKIIEHQNINIGIIQMFNKTPKGFESFLPIMKEYISINKNEILDNISKLESSKILLSPHIWNFSIKTEPDKVLSQFNKLILENNNILTKNKINEILDLIDNDTNYVSINRKMSKLHINLDIQTILIILQYRKTISIKNGKINKLVNNL
jgi:ubiquitin-protein ligase